MWEKAAFHSFASAVFQLTSYSNFKGTYHIRFLSLFPFSALQNIQLPEKAHYRLRGTGMLQW